MLLLDIDRPRTPLARLLSLAETRVPKQFAGVVEQIRRDVAIVEGRLIRGARPSSLVKRRTRSEVSTPAPAATSTTSTAAPTSAVAVAPTKPTAKAETVALVTIEDGDTTHSLEVLPGRFLLETALETGAPIPFSCTLGGCGSCKVTLLEGSIELEDPHCLTPDELDAGIRLTCVGRVTSPTCRVRLDRDVP